MLIDRKQSPLGEQTSSLWTWWKHDPLPVLASLPDWHVESAEERSFLAQIPLLAIDEALHRCHIGHRAYCAYLGKKLVAYGWSAINNATFSPGGNFQVPTPNLYLYHFATLLPWRGRGFYPRLLQEILQREMSQYERFWIIHQSSNIASRRGIAKAGFSMASGVFQVAGGGVALVPDANLERARAGSALLGLPLLETAL